jgi:NAD(P)-dependent dehydrogenase (short-subunit alcohol dehydrogenase family)
VFEDPNYERRPYDAWLAYGQSKTANILFALAADERGKADGVRAFSLHPGSVAGTGLERHVSREALQAGGVLDEHGRPIIDPARGFKTVQQGAATSVWCATSLQLDGMGGVLCQDCDIAPLVSQTNFAAQLGSLPLGVLPYAVDPEAADRLWDLSDRLVRRAT